MAEATGQGWRSRSPRRRSAWVPVGAATGALILLSAGWSLVSWFLPDSEAVHAGQDLQVAAGTEHTAALTFPQGGWAIVPSATRDGQQYRFDRGPVQLTVNAVIPPFGATVSAPELWDGLHRVVRVDDASASLGDPETVSSADGTEGLAGDLHGDAQEGTAAVYPSPDGQFAVEMTLAGPEATSADLAAVDEIVHSLEFEGAGGES